MKLQIHKSESAAEAERYFTQALEAYYSKDGQEFVGDWMGKGAELLGLRGHVTQEAFARLVNNLHPLTGEQLTDRMRADRRPGFDITIGFEKSFSVLFAKTKDDRFIQIGREVARELIEEAQEYAAVRVRAGGDKNRDEDRITKNLVCAEHIHLTARPEDGYSDPHVHFHLYIMNVSYDPEEKKWKALQMGYIHELADYLEKVGTKRTQELLEKRLGLETVPTDHSFEIKGFTRPIVEKFSRRTMTIEETAQRLGITDPAQKAKLGAMTREQKLKNVKMTDFEPFWWANPLPGEEEAYRYAQEALNRSRASELSQELAGEASEQKSGLTAEAGPIKSSLGQKDESWAHERVKSVSNRRPSMNRATRPRPSDSVERNVIATDVDREAIALAIEHILERKSVAKEHEIVAEAAGNWRLYKTTRGGLWAALAEAPLCHREKDGWHYVTTPQVLAEEKCLIELCKGGKGKHEPINEFWKISDEMLNGEQRAAVLHALNCNDFISGVTGEAPGVGKTTLMREIKRGAESGYYRVITLAPGAHTAHEVLGNDGFENAHTIEHFLRSERLQKEARGAVLLVDEASQISTRLGNEFLGLARSLGARVILVGDMAQHHAVERGQAFDLLRNKAEMSVAEVSEIVRQHGPYKEFVEQFINGDPRRAITSLWGMEGIIEKPLEELGQALAADYIAALKSGESVLAISPTHAGCDFATEAIRQGLKENQMLEQGVEWNTLWNLAWTDAQKCDWEHFEKGQVIQFNSHVKGFALGEQVEVIDAKDGVVRVRSEERFTTKIKPLPLSRPKTFGVYERRALEICPGDQLRITGNTRSEDGRRLSNGSVRKVDYISHDGKIVLENGQRIGKDFKHLDHGYVLTSYAAQGKTVARVLVLQTEELSTGATDRTQSLVSMTRGREGLGVYTTSFEWLKDSVSMERERPMATEIFQGEAEEKHRGEQITLSAELGQVQTGAVLDIAADVCGIPKPEQQCEREIEEEMEIEI